MGMSRDHLIYYFVRRRNFTECCELAVMLQLSLGNVLSEDFTEFIKYVNCCSVNLQPNKGKEQFYQCRINGLSIFLKSF